MRTFNLAHRIIAALGHVIAGAPATGTCTATAAEGAGSVVIPKRTLGFLVPVSAAGNAQMDPSLAVRVSQEMEVDEDGGPIPIETTWGSPAHNLPAGTLVRWLAPPTGLLATSPVDAPGLAGAAFGLARRVVLYEALGTLEARRDMWLATAAGPNNFPSIVLQWTGSSGYDYDVTGRRDTYRDEEFTIFVICSRLDNAVSRAVEGFELLDRIERRLSRRTTEPLGHLASAPGVRLKKRERVLTSNSSYVYALTFTVGGAFPLDVEAGNSPYADWLTTQMLFETSSIEQGPTPPPIPPAEETPPIVIVDESVEMPHDP